MAYSPCLLPAVWGHIKQCKESWGMVTSSWRLTEGCLEEVALSRAWKGEQDWVMFRREQCGFAFAEWPCCSVLALPLLSVHNLLLVYASCPLGWVANLIGSAKPISSFSLA